MENYNLVATLTELGVKRFKLKGEEAIDLNNYQSLIDSMRCLTCIRSDISFTIYVAS
jgi:hypothetical protein